MDRRSSEGLAAAGAGLLGGWVAADLHHLSLAVDALRVLLRLQLLPAVNDVEDLCTRDKEA